MAKLQPFSNQNTRAQEIIRQATEQRLAKKEAKRIEELHDYGTLNSIIGSTSYFNKFGDEKIIQWQMKAVSMKEIRYEITGMSLALENGSYLTPVIMIDMDCRLRDFGELHYDDMKNDPKWQWQFWRLFNTAEPDVINYERDTFVGSSNKDAKTELYQKWIDYTDTMDLLTEYGMRPSWDISETVVQHAQAYFRTNELKFRVHDYLIAYKNKDVACVNSVKLKLGKCFVSWSDRDGGNYGEIISEKILKNYNKYRPLYRRFTQAVPCLHESRLNQLRRQCPTTPNVPYYYYEVLDHDTPKYYLLSTGEAWFKVEIPQENENNQYQIRFPNDWRQDDFSLGDNWVGTYSMDYYHAVYPRTFRVSGKIEGEYTADDTPDGVAQPWDIISPLFTLSYKNQLQNEHDPNYTKPGTGFQIQKKKIQSEPGYVSGQNEPNNWHLYVKQD